MELLLFAFSAFRRLIHTYIHTHDRLSDGLSPIYLYSHNVTPIYL